MIVDAAADKKAADIRLLDVRELTTLADYFVICQGSSDRQINAIIDGIRQELKEHGESIYHLEGTAESGWILMDYGSVLTHVFSADRRNYYQIEALWQEAPTILRML